MPIKQREVLEYVGQVEAAMVKGFPFEVPKEYADRPLLKVGGVCVKEQDKCVCGGGGASAACICQSDGVLEIQTYACGGRCCTSPSAVPDLCLPCLKSGTCAFCAICRVPEGLWLLY